MWYLGSLERAGVIQKLTILERKNGLVLSNTHVPVSGTWSIPFPKFLKEGIVLRKEKLTCFLNTILHFFPEIIDLDTNIDGTSHAYMTHKTA